MRYVLLIYGVEVEYANMSPQDHAALMQGHAAFAEETLKSNQITGGAPLQSTRTARTVRVRGGKVSVTDGPFAETKEQLGGIYILDCKNLEEAVALAAKIPDARYGCVEVRPALDL
ncbi:MAG TPA: YciI family protein [Aggregatilineales bacterium]|nr:YciI family protein [Aggregatilineales bacterium]